MLSLPLTASPRADDPARHRLLRNVPGTKAPVAAHGISEPQLQDARYRLTLLSKQFQQETCLALWRASQKPSNLIGTKDPKHANRGPLPQIAVFMSVTCLPGAS